MSALLRIINFINKSSIESIGCGEDIVKMALRYAVKAYQETNSLRAIDNVTCVEIIHKDTTYVCSQFILEGVRFIISDKIWWHSNGKKYDEKTNSYINTTDLIDDDRKELFELSIEGNSSWSKPNQMSGFIVNCDTDKTDDTDETKDVFYGVYYDTYLDTIKADVIDGTEISKLVLSHATTDLAQYQLFNICSELPKSIVGMYFKDCFIPRLQTREFRGDDVQIMFNTCSVTVTNKGVLLYCDEKFHNTTQIVTNLPANNDVATYIEKLLNEDEEAHDYKPDQYGIIQFIDICEFLGIKFGLS